MPRHTDRRTVLKTTGGLLAGATAFAGTGAAQQERVPSLQMTIRREKDLFEEGNPFFVEVMVPMNPISPTGTAAYSPTNIFLAVRDAYQVIGVFVLLNEKDWAANPESVEQVSENRLRMTFFPQDIFFPQDVFEKRRVTMALGVFPDTSDEEIPSTEVRFWDTDTVAIEELV